MLRKMVSYGGTLLLAGAVMLTTPAFGWAQRGGGHGGGGHGGGGHVGGGHFGGTHFGGTHFGGTHFGGTQFGGTHIGGFRGGLHRSGYRSYYGGYYYPYYDTYPYAASTPAYDMGYSSSYPEDTRSYDDDYAGVTPPPISYANADVAPASTALITVKVPAGAEVWFDGTKMKTTGLVREYESPALTPDSQYTYEIQARWNENGHEMRQTQQINIAAGSHVNVSFPVAAATSASPAKQN